MIVKLKSRFYILFWLITHGFIVFSNGQLRKPIHFYKDEEMNACTLKKLKFCGWVFKVSQAPLKDCYECMSSTQAWYYHKDWLVEVKK
jgi:hypothetical protein